MVGMEAIVAVSLRETNRRIASRFWSVGEWSSPYSGLPQAERRFRSRSERASAPVKVFDREGVSPSMGLIWAY